MNSSIDAHSVQRLPAPGAEAISDTVLEAAVGADIQLIPTAHTEAHFSGIGPLAVWAGIERAGRRVLDAARLYLGCVWILIDRAGVRTGCVDGLVEGIGHRIGPLIAKLRLFSARQSE